MLQIRRVRDDPLDLGTTEDRGELAGLAHRRNRDRGPIALQRRVVEKPQAVDDDVAGIPGSVSVLNQVPEIRLHLLIGKLVGRSMVELGQPGHRRQVRLAGTHRHPAHNHIVIHPSSELRHHTPPS